MLKEDVRDEDRHIHSPSNKCTTAENEHAEEEDGMERWSLNLNYEVLAWEDEVIQQANDSYNVTAAEQERFVEGEENALQPAGCDGRWKNNDDEVCVREWNASKLKV